MFRKKNFFNYKILKIWKKNKAKFFSNKKGWIHGKTVAAGWTGAVMQKPLEIQKYL